jgi:hypothetical protein
LDSAKSTVRSLYPHFNGRIDFIGQKRLFLSKAPLQFGSFQAGLPSLSDDRGKGGCGQIIYLARKSDVQRRLQHGHVDGRFAVAINARAARAQSGSLIPAVKSKVITFAWHGGISIPAARMTRVSSGRLASILARRATPSAAKATTTEGRSMPGKPMPFLDRIIRSRSVPEAR